MNLPVIQLLSVSCSSVLRMWQKQFPSFLRLIKISSNLTNYCFTLQSAYADFGGYLVTNEASLDGVNERLQQKVTMNNFRPNIVINGCEAFDEVMFKPSCKVVWGTYRLCPHKTE